MTKKCGYIALLGATNAGKSTLLNTIMAEKIAIVSRKVQTTRGPIRGVRNEGEAQMIFVDTPGVFAASSKFDRAMVSAAWSAMDSADAVAYIIDASKGLTATTTRIVEKLRTVASPKCAILNKVDLVPKAELLPMAQMLGNMGLFDEIFMLSAARGDGLSPFLKWAEAKMPEAPWEYSARDKTDMPLPRRLAEITREKVYQYLHQELPYMIAVATDDMEGSVVRQTIYTSEKAHRQIIIGKLGAKLKQIGIAARADIEKILGRKINLELEVVVEKDWKNLPEFFASGGLDYK